MDKSKQERREQTIRIALSERHWVVVLALLDQFISKKVKPELDKLRKKGVKLDEIDDVQSATLAGPIMIRGIIVKELATRGIVKPELNELIGIDKYLSAAHEFSKGLGEAGQKSKKSKPGTPNLRAVEDDKSETN